MRVRIHPRPSTSGGFRMRGLRPRIVDLWCGTKSASDPFKEAGWDRFTVDNDPQHNPDLCADILKVKASDLPDCSFIWASPSCTVYSKAGRGYGHFDERTLEPISPEAVEQTLRVKHTLALIKAKNPDYWVLENPWGMLRKQPFMRQFPRVTITYCRYGDCRQKPTDLWGRFPETWSPRPPCSRGMKCHVAAPSGSSTGTQGTDRIEAGRVPYLLGEHLRIAAETSNGASSWITIEEVLNWAES